MRQVRHYAPMGDGERDRLRPAGYDPWTDPKLRRPVVLKVQNATHAEAMHMVELAARIASVSFIGELRATRPADVTTFTSALDAVASADRVALRSVQLDMAAWPELDLEDGECGARHESAITLLHAVTYAIFGDRQQAAFCVQRCLDWADLLDKGSGANYEYLAQALDVALTAPGDLAIDQQANSLRWGLAGLV